MTRSNCTAALALLLSLAAYASPATALTVGIGNYTVAPGTQVIAPISVTNAASASFADIEGMTFTLQISGGTGSTPIITSVDLLTATIWSGHTSPAHILTPAGGNQPQYQSRDVLTNAAGDFVDANGLLATATFDTTGASPGVYDLKLIGTKTAGRDSTFLNHLGQPLPATFAQGILTIVVPEPASTAFAFAVIAITTTAVRRRSS